MSLSRWYADRREVRQWQEHTIDQGRKRGFVTTLLGRRRNLPGLRDKDPRISGHAERAAINTPIQGSAADIVTAAMIRIHADRRLKELGWKLLLQVHDEVIVEGPEESAEEAQRIVVECMEAPFPTSDGLSYHNPLLVDLTVDSKYAKTWFDAK